MTRGSQPSNQLQVLGKQPAPMLYLLLPVEARLNPLLVRAMSKVLAAATALHSDDENLNPDVALRCKEKEEKKRRKAEKKVAKEERKRIEEEERERRAIESVGRVYERRS